MSSTTSHVYFPKLDLALLTKRTSRDADTKFPCKLHKLLNDVEEQGLTHIISWHPDGRCFRVHEPDEFVEKILPSYFKKSKYRSFQRQLNLYGFHRITALKPFWESCYHHPEFSRDDESACRKITRPLRRKGGQKIAVAGSISSLDTTETNDEIGHRSKQAGMSMVNFMAPFPPSTIYDVTKEAPLALQEHRQAINVNELQVDEEPLVTREIFELHLNEQPKPLSRRNSYQDLCQTIMGPDCPTCNDEAKLFQDLFQDNSVSPGF
jgi:hypothetical protein